MCGICGIIGQVTDRSKRVEAMIKVMDHRGPDDSGIFDDNYLTLGMTRLAILDTSPAGHQPMSNSEKTIWMVYNGEMYNFKEEKALLQELGYEFTSRSDTEVILKMYQAYGDEFVHRIRGIFALVIYDKRLGQGQEKVFMARGPIGAKPLLYAQKPSELVFASEMKAMLTSGLIKRELDPESLRLLLTYGSITQPRTILKEVKMLLPGHYLIISNGQEQIVKFWRFDLSQTKELAKQPHSKLVGLVKNQLQEIVKMQMASDVPLGAFLSGGIDSTALVALISNYSPTKVKTFSVGFGKEGKDIDETNDAAKIAQRFNVEHTRVEITGEDFKNHARAIARALDQPSVDGVNSYFVSKAAKAGGVTVALSGTGGDEIFAGYPWFTDLAKEYMLHRPITRLVKGALAKLVAGKFWNRLRLNRPAGIIDKLRGGQSFLHKFIREYLIYRNNSAADILTPEVNQKINWRHNDLTDIYPADELAHFSVIQRVSSLCLKGYTQNQLLRDIDAVSMAHSLEVRVPYLDTELVNLVLSLPDDTKLNLPPYPKGDFTYRATGAKRILIDAVRDLLPPDIDLQAKKGFGLPMTAWLKGSARDLLDSTLSPAVVAKRGIFKVNAINMIKRKFLAGRLHWSLIWLPMIVELWCQEVLDTF